MLPQQIKTVLYSLRKRPRLFVAAWLVVMLAVFAWRLSLGPIRIDGLKPIILSRIENQLPGTRADIRHLDLVWFGDARAIGFRIEGLMVRDGQNRIILRAGRLETALAADSLLLAHLAPARLTAHDFFLAVSVSDEGRYELGYEARGPAHINVDLERFFFDLTGPETLGRPVSYARQAHLRDGELRLMQQGAPLDWTAKISIIDFSKLKGRLSAKADLAITGPGGTGYLLAESDGMVGLKQASIHADVRHLNPARVFPSVGITRHLAIVDASVSGRTRIHYSRARGFDGAWVDLEAREGHIDFRSNRQTFDSARVTATYASADRTAHFDTFRLRSNLLDTDLKGTLVVTPADSRTKSDLRLAFDFAGPRLTGRLADDFRHQTLADARIRGTYVPYQRRLDIETATGALNGAPFAGQGVVYTDAEGRLGADLTATIQGRFGKDEVFAFWPEALSPGTRSELINRIQGGDYRNADFVLKAPPGHFEEGKMEDADLRLDFDFANLGLVIDHRMAQAESLSGHGTLLGNSFRMEVDGGRLVDVALKRGVLTVPDFHDRSSHTTIRLETESTAAAAIAAVDPLADGELLKAGLTQDRLSGQALVRVDISFPTFGHIGNHNFDLRFDGRITQAGLKEAALGWDLSQGDLTVRGDLLGDRIEVAGPARVGPYTGDVTYRTHFAQRAQSVDFKGSFNAEQFGGSPRVPVAIAGHFAMAGGKGEGTVESDIFRGKVNWEGEGQRPSLVTIEGATLSAGMQAQGLPVFKRLKSELPTRISLLRSGEIWSGEVDAEALTGDIAYIEGQRPRLVYKAVITPQEARALGYGGLPVFNAPRNLTVNVALDEESKEARLKLDDMTARLGWSEVAGSDDVLRRMTMTVRPEDWETLGLPPRFFKPDQPTEVLALWQQRAGQLEGQVRFLGQAIDFEMPSENTLSPDDPYTLRVAGRATREVLQGLGYTHDPVTFEGDAGFVVKLYDTPGRPDAIVNVDAGSAQLGVNATDWNKPVGETAQVLVVLDDRGEGLSGVDLSQIVVRGDRLRLQGRAAIDGEGELEFADFSDVYLDNFIDVNYKFYTTGDSDVIALSGRRFDLRPWLGKTKRVISEGDASQDKTFTTARRPMRLVVDLDQVALSAQGAFADLSLDLNWDGSNAIGGMGTAVTADGVPLALTFVPQAGYSLFSLTTDDLGSVIRTASGAANVKGGRAVLEGAYMDGQIDATLKGEDVRVKQIPVLAQLLTVASLQGVADTLTGEGIAFSDFAFPMRWRSGRLFIRDGWAEGSGLGFSVRGTSDLTLKSMEFDGTLIPAYRINAIFGDLGSNGLGLLGLKYGVKGTFASPQVWVDPLSVMMPGFLKVWERQQTEVDAITALKLPPVTDRLAEIRKDNQARLKD